MVNTNRWKGVEMTTNYLAAFNHQRCLQCVVHVHGKQTSNGKNRNYGWLKVPLALGVDGYFLYNLLNKQKEYNKYNDIVNIYNSGGTYPDVTEQSALNFRAAARTNREYAWVYLIVGHLVTVFDAYVDRHLMDFDISPDLTFVGSDAGGISLVIPLNQAKKKKVLPLVLTMP